MTNGFRQLSIQAWQRMYNLLIWHLISNKTPEIAVKILHKTRFLEVPTTFFSAFICYKVRLMSARAAKDSNRLTLLLYYTVLSLKT